MIIAVLVVLGLCFGSFLDASVWRLHQQSLPAKKRAAPLKELSISKGRSMCGNCKHTLAPLDLVPVLSWVFLKGRCRYCSHPIGVECPIVEVLTALLFVGSYVFWPFAFDGRGVFLLVIWLIAVVGLLSLAIYDIRWMLLPNKLVFPLIALAAVQTVVVSIFYDGGLSYALNSAASLAIAGGIFFGLYQLSDGKWIGGGDVKLGYALGLLLARPSLAFLMLFVASLLGLLAAVPGLVTKKLAMTSRLPFGPYLIVATSIVLLFGQSFLDWYFRLETTTILK